MELSLVVTILLPLLSGLLGSYLTYYFTIRSKRIETIAAYKEKAYQTLLALLQT